MRQFIRVAWVDQIEFGGVHLTVVNTITLAALRKALESSETDLDVLWPGEWLESIDTLPGTAGQARAADSGPFAVLIEIGCDILDGVRVKKAFACPVYSMRQLVPVGAAHERHTLEVLLYLQRQLLQQHLMVFSIRKITPDMRLYDCGVAFQLHRVGPNGQPIHALDVLSVDHAEAQVPLQETLGSDVVYHRARASQRALTMDDVAFCEALTTHLLAAPKRRLQRAGHPLPSQAPTEQIVVHP